MNYEKPATGILKEREYVSDRYYSASYMIPCSCGCLDHTMNMVVEVDDGFITVRHYVKTKTDWWSHGTWWYPAQQFWLRLKHTYRLWVRGYLEYEADTMLDKRQAYNYANALIDAVRTAERFEKHLKERNESAKVSGSDTQV